MTKQRLFTFGAVIGFVIIAWLVPASLGSQEATILPPTGSPEQVTWEGMVIGVLESGGSLAIQRPDGSGLFMAILEEPIDALPEGTVRIRGVRGEDTCAYRNTVFRGECVPQLLDAVIDATRE